MFTTHVAGFFFFSSSFFFIPDKNGSSVCVWSVCVWLLFICLSCCIYYQFIDCI